MAHSLNYKLVSATEPASSELASKLQWSTIDIKLVVSPLGFLGSLEYTNKSNFLKWELVR